jgi:hypothetical protein
MDKKTTIRLALPLAVTVAMLIAALYIPLGLDLSDVQKNILGFMKSDLTIETKQSLQIKENLVSPIEFDLSELEQVHEENVDLVQEVDEEDPVVSLIVISGKKRMAMIQGVPVKEGDYYDDKRIVKIEPDRVLLKNIKSNWVYIGE